MPITTARDEDLEQAARLIRAGELVAFPTETVYGLGADATNGAAVARIFQAKGRPHFNPLIVHVADLAAAEKLAEMGPVALKLAKAFWPGPLTLVLRRRMPSPLSDLVTAGLDTVALRMPAHPIARALLQAAGRPIAAPSANRSGHVSPTRAEHVDADLGSSVTMILDGGPTERGIESTVIDATATKPVLLRAGAIETRAIEVLIGSPIARNTDQDERPHSPGQLASHYAPTARVRLNASGVVPGEALLAFGSDPPATTGPSFNLSRGGDLVEAAANLFAALRSLDAEGVDAIAVMPIPNEGLGEAINDRLQRAAAAR